MVNGDSSTEVKEPSAWNILVGWAFGALYIAIVGNISFTPFWASALGMFMFLVAFGVIVALNWSWAESMLDFDLSDFVGGGGSVPLSAFLSSDGAAGESKAAGKNSSKNSDKNLK